MKKTVIIIMFITIFSKVIGLGREIVLAYYYGASSMSDAYLIAQTIPIVIFAFIGQAISTGYIPLYSRIFSDSGEKQAKRYTDNLITILIVITALVFLLGQVFTEQVVRVFASGFEGATLDLAVQFTRYSLISIVFLAIINVFNAFLRVKGNYAITALIGIPMNVVVIISIILSYKINIVFLGIGIAFSIIAQLLFLIPFVWKKKYRFRWHFDLKDPNIKILASLAAPIIIGVAINDINKIVDRTIASQIIVGGIAMLNYANKLKWLILSITATSFTTVLYPVITKMVVEKKNENLKKVISEAITGINLLIMPATVGVMLLSVPIIELLFGRGAFDTEAILMTSDVMIYYSIGMIGVALREVLARPFYAMQDMKTPMTNSSIGMMINIILNIILSYFIGLKGIALATSIAAIISAILMFVSLRKKIGPFGMKQISVSFVKILFASLVMGLLAKLSFNYLTASLSQNLSLLLAIGVGAVSYFVIIYFMKIEDVDVIVGAVKKKIGKGISKAK